MITTVSTITCNAHSLVWLLFHIVAIASHNALYCYIVRLLFHLVAITSHPCTVLLISYRNLYTIVMAIKRFFVFAVVLSVMIMLVISWTLHSEGSTHIAIRLTDPILNSKTYHNASHVGYWQSHGGVTCNVSVSSAPSPNISTALERWRKQVFSTDTQDLSSEKFTIVMLTYIRGYRFWPRFCGTILCNTTIG